MSGTNKSFDAFMGEVVKNLVDNGTYDKATNHVTFDPKKVELPEGITTDSLTSHVTFINNLSGGVEQATAEIARTQYADNDQLTTVDGTLTFDGFNVNSQHHLKQQVGEEFIYGQVTTAVDYSYTDEQTSWLDTQRTANQELAQKLFG